MRSAIRLVVAFATTGLIVPSNALPAPQVGIGIPTVDPAGPPGASGSLRGPTSLLGFNPAVPEPTTGSTEISPDDFQLPPGSTENEDLGLFLDMSTVKNPQPIRGGNGKDPTDPGPRKLALIPLFSFWDLLRCERQL